MFYFQCLPKVWPIRNQKWFNEDATNMHPK